MLGHSLALTAGLLRCLMLGHSLALTAGLRLSPQGLILDRLWIEAPSLHRYLHCPDVRARHHLHWWSGLGLESCDCRCDGASSCRFRVLVCLGWLDRQWRDEVA